MSKIEELEKRIKRLEDKVFKTYLRTASPYDASKRRV